MLKQTLTFEDFNGQMVTEDFYFNLTKAEVVEMEMSQQGGLFEYLQKIIKDKNGPELIAAFKELIRKAYGERSEDGKRFIKNDIVWSKFIQTNAYSEFFMELISNSEKAAEFIVGIVPKDLQAKVREGQLTQQVEQVEQRTEELFSIPEVPKDDRPAWVREDRDPTKSEARNMTREQLVDAFVQRTQK